MTLLFHSSSSGWPVGIKFAILNHMKSLSLSTPRVLFVVGIPGAGKTHFAEKFSETFSAPFLQLEAIRAGVTDKPTYDAAEQKSVDAIASLMFDELLKTGKTILYEGGLETRSARTMLARRARQAGYEPLLVWVQTEPATAKQRAVKGVRGGGNQLIPEQRYDHLSQKFTAPNQTEKTVVISGKHTYASQAKIVLRRLAEGRPSQSKDNPSIRVPERRPRKTGNITVTQS